MNKNVIQKEIEYQKELLRYYYLKEYFDWKRGVMFKLGRYSSGKMTTEVIIDELLDTHKMEIEYMLLKREYIMGNSLGVFKDFRKF